MAQSKQTTITDPKAMRAMAHPARIEIMEHLTTTGAVVTATEMAGVVGLSPSATSYHLRELAKLGLVEQAPSRGDARERVWRSTSSGWNVDPIEDGPEVREAEQVLVDVYLTRDFARMKEWIAGQHREPKAWRDAVVLSGHMLLLTAEELTQLNAAVRELLEPYSRRERIASAPEGARSVAVRYTAFPVD